MLGGASPSLSLMEFYGEQHYEVLNIQFRGLQQNIGIPNCNVKCIVCLKLGEVTVSILYL